MDTYRRRPQEVLAERITDDNLHNLSELAGGTVEPGVGINIPTLEGVMLARIGDYLIKGTAGEFYPCKQDIFLSSFDKVGGTVTTSSLGL